MILEQESNYQFVHSAWHISMAVAILFLLPQTPPEEKDIQCEFCKMDLQGKHFYYQFHFLISAETDKYTILNSRTSYPPPESSFKHYVGDDNGPEVINMTSTAASTILPPDQVIDVSR